MKKKFKPFISVLLSIMMVISMVSISFTAINAATVDDSSVGATTYYLWYRNDGNDPPYSNHITMSANGSNYVGTFEVKTGSNFGFLINTSSSSDKTGCVWSSAPTVNKSADFSWAEGGSGYWSGQNYFFVKGSPTSNFTMKVVYSPSTKAVTISKDDGSSGGGETYYIGGRFQIKDEKGTLNSTGNWNASYDKIPFSPVEGKKGLYKVDTYSTVSELSANIGDYAPFFLIHNQSSTWYGGSNSNLHNFNEKNSYDKAVTLSSHTGDTTEDKLIKFNSTSSTDKGNVTIYLDATGTSLKLYYITDTVTEITDGEIALTDGTPVNGSLSFKAEGKTPGTADVNDNVTITASPFAGFTCSGITASYTDKAGTLIEKKLTVSNNSASFTVPDVTADADGKKSISFAASFTLDKKSYLSSKGEGLWIDVAPSQTDSTATLIKWNNYYSYNHNTSTNPYTFYVPKNVDLSKAQIYNGYSSSVTVNGTSISAKSFGTVNLNFSGESHTFTTSKGNLKVMQGSTNAMFLYTTKKGTETALRTQTYADWNAPADSVSKADEKTDGGSCVTMTNDTATAEFSTAMSLDSVKGRGNSSWEASAKRFGKYAYNMKLSEKTTLFGMAKDTKKSAGSKSWCLLANNADESMLRNALAYDLANEVGLYSSPEFSFVDIYDNGEYLGQYLVTEKVDVGTSKLIYGESIEDINEDAGLVFDETSKNKTTASYNGKSYSYCYTTETTGTKSPDISNATYLLEFEINERYESEPCWFTTPQGQHVVVKTPEFATKEQVQYIAQKFIDMETEVFNNSNNAALSKYIDLDSFANMYLVQELSSNLDAASTSYYVTYDCSKGDNARFVASPVWDYDWAFGQYKNKAKYDVNGTALDPTATNAWYAKSKRYDDSSLNAAGKYSIQSKLANNTYFQQVIKKVWDGTSTQEGFYAKVQKYYGSNSKIDTWYNQISASVNMNETRWGFIAGSNISDWGTNETGATHSATVNYLENTFLSPRAVWLNTQFASYPAYTQIAEPTLKAYQADGSTELVGEVPVGTSIVLKAETTETFVEYELYKDDQKVDSNTTGEFTLTLDSSGTFNYTVKTVYKTSDTKTSNSVAVTVTGGVVEELTGVSITSNQTNITKGNSVTLTAAPSPSTLTDITYTFYSSTDQTVSSDDKVIGTSSPSKTIIVTPADVGTYFYYVKAEKDSKTVTSSFVKVVVLEPSQETHTVKVWFKSASAIPYTPSVRLDAGSYKTMTRIKQGEDGSTYIGSTYSGTLKFFWYYADIDINSKTTHTLTFKTASTSVLAKSEFNNFSESEYYFAVDNLMQDTKLVDLTDKDEAIKNFHRSATHMVYNEVLEGDNSLGYTFINGKEYAMGEIVNEETQKEQSSLQTEILHSRLSKINILNPASVGAYDAPFTIDSPTLAQKCSADLENVSKLQMSLLDVNLDGKVDILDATIMQKALVQ